MNKPLRSLSGLIDFECAARWSSFKLAALELHKTPAAVSQQIKHLEVTLGFAVFIRHPRHIALTEKGQELAAAVRKMLAELQTKVTALQGGDEEKILRISTSHSLAIKWLVPRIGRFTSLHPELDIRIDSTDQLANLDDDRTDIAIRFGTVNSGDPALLFCERLVAIYSPALLAPGQPALTLADLPRFPLLHTGTTDDWIHFLRENQALRGQPDFSRGYSNFAVQVQAALTGQGVGLVFSSVACEDIRSGALKMIAARSAPCNLGYRFLFNSNKGGMDKIEHFRIWLHNEMDQMRRWFDAAAISA